MKQTSAFFSIARQPGEGYRALEIDISDTAISEQSALDLLDEFEPNIFSGDPPPKTFLLCPSGKQHWLVHVGISRDTRGNAVFSQHWYRRPRHKPLGILKAIAFFLLGSIATLFVFLFVPSFSPRTPSPRHAEHSANPSTVVRLPGKASRMPDEMEPVEADSEFEQLLQQHRRLKEALHKSESVRRKLIEFMTQKNLGFVADATLLEENAWVKIVAISEQGPPAITGEDLTTYDGKALISLLDTLKRFEAEGPNP